jgi:hypothetical protein
VTSDTSKLTSEETSKTQGSIIAENDSLKERIEILEQEIYHLSKRITAVNTALVRATMQQQIQTSSSSTKTAASPTPQASTPPVSIRVVGNILREHQSTFLKRNFYVFMRRRQNLTKLIAPAFHSLLEEGINNNLTKNGFQVQESELLVRTGVKLYTLENINKGLSAIHLGISMMIPPKQPTELLSFSLTRAGCNSMLANGIISVDANSSLKPISLPIPPLEREEEKLYLSITALPSVAQIGVRIIEWRKLSILRQLKDFKLFCALKYQ